MTSDIEQKLIRELIPKFNKDIIAKILHDTQMRSDDMELYSPSQYDRKIQIPSLKGNYCFRIRLKLPVQIFMPKAASILSGIIVSHRYSEKFPTAFVATYIVNLNHFTLLRLFGENADFFPERNNHVYEDSCRKFVYKDRIPSELSSLNFLEMRNMKKVNMTVEEISVAKKCFEFSYWKIPSVYMNNEYSTMHNFIYNNSQKIFGIYRVFKTIFMVEKIKERTRYWDFKPHGFNYRDAEGIFLAENDAKLINRKISLIVSEPTASKLKEGDIVNAILVFPERIKGIHSSKCILAGTIGNKISKMDYRAIISIIFYKINQEISETSKLVESLTIDELKSKVNNMIETNKMLFDSGWCDLESDFSESIDKMYPYLFKFEDRMYFIPPVLLGYLVEKDVSITEEKQVMMDIIRLVNMIETKDGTMNKTKINKMDLRTSEFADRLQKSKIFTHNWQPFLSDLPRLANRMVYSRIISQ